MNALLGSLSSGTVAEVVGGRLSGNPQVQVLRARADSRICRSGDLYIALPGERTDGNLYVAEAWEAGAGVVLASSDVQHPSPGELHALITVNDSLVALHRLAAWCRDESRELRVVGITGSNGKTTTKNILAAILSHWIGDALLATEGNYNSDIGLPLTLVGLRNHHRMAVLEMGMNRIGEMAVLAELSRPEIAVITNIGSAHIGMVGSREALAAEKRSIFCGASAASTAILSAFEPWREFLLDGYPGHVRYFGQWGESGWESWESRGFDGFVLRRKGREIVFPLPGRHNLNNAMAAVEAALALGVPESSIVAGLESVKPAFGRSDVRRGVTTVIRDYYNANPESLAAALEMLSETASGIRKIVVLGELQELGGESEEALRAAGEAVVQANPEVVVLFGDSLETTERAMVGAGYRGELKRTDDIDVARDFLMNLLRPGDAILLKGSRGSALERLDGAVMHEGAG